MLINIKFNVNIANNLNIHGNVTIMNSKIFDCIFKKLSEKLMNHKNHVATSKSVCSGK